MLSGKISCFILTEINREFWSRPSPFSTKTDSYSPTGHKNFQKQNKISLFNYSMLDYISPITLSLISIEEILIQLISLNPHTRLGFKHHPIQEYFRKMYRKMGWLVPIYGTFHDLLPHCSYSTTWHSEYRALCPHSLD